MKAKFYSVLFGLLLCATVHGQVKIGDNPQNIHPSSVLELESTTRALVVTRITTAQMNAMVPLQGAVVYNTENQCLHYYSGTAWINLCEALEDGKTFSANAITNPIPTIIITETGNNVNFEVGQITGDNIVNGSINGAVDIQFGSVTQDILAFNSVGRDQLVDNAITSVEIDLSEVTLNTFTNDAGYITGAGIVSPTAGNVLTNDNGAYYSDAALQTAITTNATNIATNTANIVTNTTNIATNTSNITANTAAIALKENTANKSDNTALGNSPVLFPTQNAVKVYVDNALAGPGIDNQQLTLAAGNLLTLENGGAPINLTPFLDNTDNQNITIFNFNETSSILTIAIEDGGLPQTVDLSTLADEAQDLAQVLALGTDANGLIINNLADPLVAQDAATKAYVDANVGGSQDLADVLALGTNANGLNITNLADPILDQDAATKAYVDANVGGAQDLADVLALGTDANGLNITNLADPVLDQDAATKSYVDAISGGAQDLADVLALGTDANGLNINNLADPVLDQDAATKSYVDALSGGAQDLADVLALGTDANGLNINNLADPVLDQDAATKAYVDAISGGAQDLADVLALGTDANGLNINNLADPILDQDAATKAYVDANSGGAQDLADVLALGTDANGLNITNLADPILDQDAATKAYVDAISGGAQDLADVLALGTDANGLNINNLADPILDQDAATKAYVDASQVVTTLVDNGDGTFTYTNEAGANTTFDSKLSTVVNNGDGTFTITDDSGTAITILGGIAYGDGEGLELAGSTFNVLVDDNTIEIVTDILSVKDGGITENKIANDAITTAKILDANVTAEKISPSTNDGDYLITNGSVVEWTSVSPNAITGEPQSLFFADTDGTPITPEDTGFLLNEKALFWNPNSRGTSGALFVGLKPLSPGTLNANSVNAKMVIAEQVGNGLAYPLKIVNEVDLVRPPGEEASSNSAVGILFSTEAIGTHGKGALVYERMGTQGRGDFHFFQNPDNNTNNANQSQAVVTIKNNGNVILGINNRSILPVPTQKLYVGGSMRLTGQFFDENNDPGTPTQILSATATGTEWIPAPSGIDTNTTNFSLTEDGTNLILTDSEGGTVSIALADINSGIDTNTTNFSLTEDGTNLILTDSEGGTVSIALADINTGIDTNTTNFSLTEDGTNLILTDSEGGTVSIALADINSGIDTNTTNFSLTEDGTNLILTDSEGGTVSIALADINSGIDTNTTNFSLTEDGTNLILTDSEGGTVSIGLADIDNQNASQVPVAVTATNYTAATQDVEAHLVGINAALAAGGGNPTDELNTAFLVNGANLEITDAGGTLQVPLNQINIDQNASQVPVTVAPTNYTAATQDVEAHLAGIDAVLPNGTPGSVFFADTDGSATENNAQLFWDTSVNKFYVGPQNATTPDVKLNVGGTTRTQGLQNSPGSFGTPAYRFSGDLNSGMFSPVTNELGFSANGQEAIRIAANQNVGIGITVPTAKLHVGGNIRAEGTIEATGDITANVPDYVFQKYFIGTSVLNEEYKFTNLQEIENFVKQHHHLPGVKSAKEIKEQGFWDLGEASRINLEKIEELYLHTINQEKEIEKLKSSNETLSSELEALKKDLAEIKKALSKE